MMGARLLQRRSTELVRRLRATQVRDCTGSAQVSVTAGQATDRKSMIRCPDAVCAVISCRRATPYHLAHGLLDHATHLSHLGDDQAAAAAIGEAAGIAARLGCQSLRDRAETTRPARPRTAAS
jgi:hypothetical protein